MEDWFYENYAVLFESPGDWIPKWFYLEIIRLHIYGYAISWQYLRNNKCSQDDPSETLDVLLGLPLLLAGWRRKQWWSLWGFGKALEWKDSKGYIAIARRVKLKFRIPDLQGVQMHNRLRTEVMVVLNTPSKKRYEKKDKSKSNLMSYTDRSRSYRRWGTGVINYKRTRSKTELYIEGVHVKEYTIGLWVFASASWVMWHSDNQLHKRLISTGSILRWSEVT